ncbi:DUF7286 family protein [Halegenticoccus soli]|uniref:DUF7286 family protein n=1 Tax=Halegenticoccus soli TaxID=1985678 RepID=UPI000C6DED60|nr:hypothetical protein [Halegenticoccus soli]
MIGALDARAERTSRTNGRFERALGDAGVGAGDRLRAVLAARENATRPTRAELGTDGPSDPFPVVPDGSPGYLTLSTVEGDRVDALPDGGSHRPLTARNVNVFTAPYDDAADGVVNALLGRDDRVALRTAGRALVAANRTLAATGNETLRGRRDRLDESVGRALAVVRR